MLYFDFRFVPKDQIDHNLILAQVMAGRRASDRPLFELMMTQFVDAFMRLKVSVKLCFPHWIMRENGLNGSSKTNDITEA